MRRYTLHVPFSIYHFEADTWTHKVHRHTYFEIIFILKGTGIHNINGNVFEYKSGDIFLLGPEDFHHFEIAEITEFSFVRFNESQHRQVTGNQDRPWRPIISNLLAISSQSRGAIVSDEKEKQKLHKLLMVLEMEDENSDAQYFEVVKDSLLRTMLVIIARNLSKQTLSTVRKDSLESILMFVKQNIFSPEKLSMTYLANQFNYAPNYISLMFKRQTGESLQRFIIKYKVSLIESRLKNSRLSLSDIAHEFNYSDESHLCKQFKTYKGMSPGEYRKVWFASS